MKLNIALLSQRDDRWKNQRLGTVDGTTIGSAGCLITCMCMLADYYGHLTTPDQMDNWLTDNQGYVQGNLYRNDAFGREFSDCSFDSTVSCTNQPAPLDQIDAYLAAGKPVVIMVDFDHDPSDGIQTHFVLIVGRMDDGTYIINDPWYGDQVFLTGRYAVEGITQEQVIDQINFFSGPLPLANQPMVPTYLQNLFKENNLDVANQVQVSAFFQKAQSFDGVASDLATCKTMLTNTQVELSQTQSQLTDAHSANNQQAVLIADLRDQLAKVQAQITSQATSTPTVTIIPQSGGKTLVDLTSLIEWLKSKLSR